MAVNIIQNPCDFFIFAGVFRINAVVIQGGSVQQNQKLCSQIFSAELSGEQRGSRQFLFQSGAHRGQVILPGGKNPHDVCGMSVYLMKTAV